MATITGTITDPTGAAVPETKITITNEATGVPYHVTADASGSYIRGMLPAGTYSVAAELEGFKKKIQRNINLELGSRVGVDLQLEMGEVTQSVEVNDAPPQLQTESAVTAAVLRRGAYGICPWAATWSRSRCSRLGWFRANPAAQMVSRRTASFPTGKTIIC
jgi:hypothetical protein